MHFKSWQMIYGKINQGSSPGCRIIETPVPPPKISLSWCFEQKVVAHLLIIEAAVRITYALVLWCQVLLRLGWGDNIFNHRNICSLCALVASPIGIANLKSQFLRSSASYSCATEPWLPPLPCTMRMYGHPPVFGWRWCRCLSLFV